MKRSLVDWINVFAGGMVDFSAPLSIEMNLPERGVAHLLYDPDLRRNDGHLVIIQGAWQRKPFKIALNHEGGVASVLSDNILLNLEEGEAMLENIYKAVLRVAEGAV